MINRSITEYMKCQKIMKKDLSQVPSVQSVDFRVLVLSDQQSKIQTYSVYIDINREKSS